MMSVKKVALILLYKSDGTMLLQHRTDDAPVFPAHWAIFGGQIEPGESPEHAVRRECGEELAYELSEPALFMIHHFAFEGLEHVIYLFVETYNGAPLTLGEGQGMGWYQLEEMQPLMMSRLDRMYTEAFAAALRGQHHKSA